MLLMSPHYLQICFATCQQLFKINILCTTLLLFELSKCCIVPRILTFRHSLYSLSQSLNARSLIMHGVEASNGEKGSDLSIRSVSKCIEDRWIKDTPIIINTPYLNLCWILGLCFPNVKGFCVCVRDSFDIVLNIYRLGYHSNLNVNV